MDPAAEKGLSLCWSFSEVVFSLSFLSLLFLRKGIPSYMEAETSVREPQWSLVLSLETTREVKRRGCL